MGVRGRAPGFQSMPSPLSPAPSHPSIHSCPGPHLCWLARLCEFSVSVSTHSVQSSLAQTFVKEDMPVIHATRDSDRCALRHRCPDSQGWMGPRHPLGPAAQGAVRPARDKLHAARSASEEVQSVECDAPVVLPSRSQSESPPGPSLLLPWPSPPRQGCPNPQPT